MKFLLTENWSIIDLLVIFGLVALLENRMFISALIVLVFSSIIVGTLKARYLN